jgi:hypothetical protein
MDRDMVVQARVRLLRANRRVVRGVEGLWIYRLLTQVEPEVYGSKLAWGPGRGRGSTPTPPDNDTGSHEVSTGGGGAAGWDDHGRHRCVTGRFGSSTATR